jgi:hypothetical protein
MHMGIEPCSNWEYSSQNGHIDSKYSGHVEKSAMARYVLLRPERNHHSCCLRKVAEAISGP